MKRTAVIITVAGMAALAVTGTALAAAQDDGPSPTAGIGTTVDDPTAAPTGDPTLDPSFDPGLDPTVEPTPGDSPTSTRPPLSRSISADDARRIALNRVGGGTVTKVESELEHGFKTWKIEIVRGGVEHDIYVDRATGTIIKADTDGDRGDRRRDDNPTHDAFDDKGGERGGHGSDDDHSGRH